jgi:hypothetical protein
MNSVSTYVADSTQYVPTKASFTIRLTPDVGITPGGFEQA